MHRIFVYGTLKRGWELAPMLAGQHFVGVARTAPHYRMVNLGEYPGLVDAGENEGVAIEGELWDVDGRCLSALDAVEGVEESEYARRAVALEPECRHAGPPVTAEAYFYLGSVDGMPDCGAVW